MGYNNAMFGLAPYGPYWRDIRKIAILKVLSNTRLLLLKHARASEVETGIRNLYSLCRRDKTGLTVVDMGQWFASVTLNMVVRTVAGTRLTEDEESQRFIKAISKFMHLLGVSAISDAIPFTE
ncbi:conserved hypothetical protein [Ricinus communis]|uniref:Cytochrome P450 n=1 Tax=Ricinus communis TaxID=3988 RepID=B9SYM3_RICCO|nr:conserved hypothetical protein [Ricinus communis]